MTFFKMQQEEKVYFKVKIEKKEKHFTRNVFIIKSVSLQRQVTSDFC